MQTRLQPVELRKSSGQRIIGQRQFLVLDGDCFCRLQFAHAYGLSDRVQKDLPSIGRLSCSQTIPTDFVPELLETLFDDVALPVNLHCLNRGDDDIAANCLTTVDSVAFLRASGHNAKLPEFLLADPRK